MTKYSFLPCSLLPTAPPPSLPPSLSEVALYNQIVNGFPFSTRNTSSALLHRPRQLPTRDSGGVNSGTATTASLTHLTPHLDGREELADYGRLGIEVGPVELHHRPVRCGVDAQLRPVDDEDALEDADEDDVDVTDEGVDDLSGTSEEMKKVSEWILQSSFSTKGGVADGGGREGGEEGGGGEVCRKKHKNNNGDNRGGKECSRPSASRDSRSSGTGSCVCDENLDDAAAENVVNAVNEAVNRQTEASSTKASMPQSRVDKLSTMLTTTSTPPTTTETTMREYTHLHEYTKSHRKGHYWQQPRQRRVPKIESIDDESNGSFAFLYSPHTHSQFKKSTARVATGSSSRIHGQVNNDNANNNFWTKIESFFK